MVRRESRVLPAVPRRRQSDDAGARSLREQAYERRMIRVRVGHDDPTNNAAGRGQNPFQVPYILGPGIKHGHLTMSDQVGIGAGPRHQACIPGNDTKHTVSDGHASPGNEFSSDFHLN